MEAYALKQMDEQGGADDGEPPVRNTPIPEWPRRIAEPHHEGQCDAGCGVRRCWWCARELADGKSCCDPLAKLD
jgi:hypothetical protein